MPLATGLSAAFHYVHSQGGMQIPWPLCMVSPWTVATGATETAIDWTCRICHRCAPPTWMKETAGDNVDICLTGRCFPFKTGISVIGTLIRGNWITAEGGTNWEKERCSCCHTIWVCITASSRSHKVEDSDLSKLAQIS